MHRLARFLIFQILAVSPAIARADYVTDVGGGHGPFACTGATPPMGVTDLYGDNGDCQRYIGSQSHTGFAGFVLVPTIPGVRWVILSASDPGYTAGYACPWAPTGPVSNPCAGQPVTYFSNLSGATTHELPWVPAAIVLAYNSVCKFTPGMDHLARGQGSAATFDGSGYSVVRITDDFGHPLKNQDGPVASNCLVAPSDYGLGPYGEWDMAVYDLP